MIDPRYFESNLNTMPTPGQLRFNYMMRLKELHSEVLPPKDLYNFYMERLLDLELLRPVNEDYCDFGGFLLRLPYKEKTKS